MLKGRWRFPISCHHIKGRFKICLSQMAVKNGREDRHHFTQSLRIKPQMVLPDTRTTSANVKGHMVPSISKNAGELKLSFTAVRSGTLWTTMWQCLLRLDIWFLSSTLMYIPNNRGLKLTKSHTEWGSRQHLETIHMVGKVCSMELARYVPPTEYYTEWGWMSHSYRQHHELISQK